MKDDNGTIIKLGDTLKSEWGYKVIVVEDENKNWVGKLVCEDSNSCKNIPYALNKGKGHIVQ